MPDEESAMAWLEGRKKLKRNLDFVVEPQCAER